MKNFIKEFKEFAISGSVFDLAIGVVIGGAFSRIVNSLVTDIINPVISVIINTENLETLQMVLKEAILDDAGNELKSAVVFRYGAFIDSIISFLIIAMVIFIVVKGINKLKRQEEEVAEEAAPTPSEEVVLLGKIYEALQKGKDN